MSRDYMSYNSAAKAIESPTSAVNNERAEVSTSAEYLEYLRAKSEDMTKVTVPSATFDGFVAIDEKMLRVKDIISQICDTDVPVLVSGESGTGKEVVARSIHGSSNRSDRPFVAINCAALPATLLESELFGYEKGAFTGAMQQRQGKFEQAEGGTLLLDEVTEMEPALQAKLLRALQEKEIERIGGSGPVKVNVRIIATTNRDILHAVAQGQFRQDLYYRLHVIQLEVPALRERPRDIDHLAGHFLQRYAQDFGKEQIELSAEAKRKLTMHNWPGNVRELQNVMQRAVLLANSSTIAARDLPIEAASVSADNGWVDQLPVGRPLKDLETRFILETLKHHRGNRTHAAKTLGISLRTLRNKINEFSSEGLEVTAPLTGRAS